jgi:hypothetical protein
MREALTRWFAVASWGVGPALVGCAGQDLGEVHALLAVTAVEEWHIDGHEAELVPIAWIAASDDGDAFISQGFDRIVLAFDQEGELRESLGGQGEGPGEFLTISRMGMLGDSLWVYDESMRRFTLFDENLQVARTETWMGSAITLEGVDFPFSTPLGVTPDRRIHAELRAMPGTPESAVMRHGLTDWEGNLERMVVEVPLGRSFAPLQSDAGRFGVHFPYALLPMYAVSANGRHSALVTVPVDGEHLGMIEVITFDQSGEERNRHRVPFEVRDVPRTEADSMIEARAESLGNQFPDIVRTFRQRGWIPPFVPPVERVIVGRDGSVWLSMSTDEEAMSRYRVVDSAGDRVGEVEFPGAVRIAAGDSRQAWGVITDDTGVGSVARYRMLWDGKNPSGATDGHGG